MTEERDTEQAGAPIDETGATDTEVMAAARRAIDPVEGVAQSTANSADSAFSSGTDSVDGVVSTPIVVEDPAATGEITGAQPTLDSAGAPAVISDVDMPSAAPAVEPVALPAPAAPAAEQIQIAPDHPMAGFYVQTPLPPEIRGNRGAGVLIALVATAGFALVYAGVLSGLIAQLFPPSTFLSEGLLPIIMSWGFIFPVAAFFVGLSALVLIVGRAGWWAYVLGGFFVAVLVWVAAVVGFAMSTAGIFDFPSVILGGDTTSGSVWQPRALLEVVGLSIPALAAAIVARETTVWFGAWIGARGRKVTAKNREVLAEYDARVAEAQAV